MNHPGPSDQRWALSRTVEDYIYQCRGDCDLFCRRNWNLEGPLPTEVAAQSSTCAKQYLRRIETVEAPRFKSAYEMTSADSRILSRFRSDSQWLASEGAGRVTRSSTIGPFRGVLRRLAYISAVQSRTVLRVAFRSDGFEFLLHFHSDAGGRPKLPKSDQLLR